MQGSIRFENIEKVYGDRVLLSIDAFTMNPGECTLISGDNGSGKTTLLKIMSGLLKPEQCTVIKSEVTLPWIKTRSMLQSESVYLHQTPYMFDTSVFNNVAYGLRATRVPKSQVDEKVWQALRWGKLDHLTPRNARLLSGGERQRVALTRARIVNPNFLLLDEPTANMDRGSRQQTYELIQSLQSEGMSIIISAHDVEAFSNIVDFHYFLEAGHLHKIDIGTKQHKHRSNAVVTPFPKGP